MVSGTPILAKRNTFRVACPCADLRRRDHVCWADPAPLASGVHDRGPRPHPVLDGRGGYIRSSIAHARTAGGPTPTKPSLLCSGGPTGSNRIATLLDGPYTTRQAIYDLRRLRRKQLIERIPHSNRYQLTPLGRRVCVLFTKAHARVLTPGLAWLDLALPEEIAQRSPLAQTWRQLDNTLNDFITHQMIAA